MLVDYVNAWEMVLEELVWYVPSVNGGCGCLYHICTVKFDPFPLQALQLHMPTKAVLLTK